ncbi:hypothetical protein [Nonomuraea ceibae]|uniref:hypothetical protein n=1 Tax=Nonomuraea ceibae TaxID=1935170 RepID=UPI001C5EF536|nr:hypothetical protein [Nonomuraea ceibae]
MGPWEEIRRRIENGDGGDGLVAFLVGLGAADRKAVAAELPGYLAARVRDESRWGVAGAAPSLRMAGAACLGGAAQVAAWLDRRELRTVPSPKADAERISRLVRDRPEPWRRDLASRLAAGLRPGGRGLAGRVDGEPGWDLAATLVIETGIEPPDNDAFVAGWVWHLHHRLWTGAGAELVRDHPLLDFMVPRLFQAEGVARPLAHDRAWNSAYQHPTVIGALAGLAGEGRLDRKALIGGCASKFLNGGDAREVEPFVALWEELRPEVAELPVVDLVRVLPFAASPLVRLAAAELRRADEAGGLGDELFAEAVGALAFRQERKYVTTALQWIAQSAPTRPATPRPKAPSDRVSGRPAEGPSGLVGGPTGEGASDLAGGEPGERAAGHGDEAGGEDASGLVSGPPAKGASDPVGGQPGEGASGRVDGAGGQGASNRVDGAVAALGLVFGVEVPSLRDRAVRLAVKLAPQASRAAREAVREAAAVLPPEALARIAAAYGEVVPAPPEAPVTTPLTAPALPGMPGPIGSAAELAAALSSMSWPHDPIRYELMLAALVEHVHRDREGTAEALRPWRNERWSSFEHGYPLWADPSTCYHPYSLLALCALAVVSPSDSAVLSRQISDYLARNPPYETVLDWFIRDRYREVVALFEAGGSVPLLLATPTARTGRLDAATLVDRLELLGDREPLPLDFCQALLRLPRAVDPVALGRAEELTSAAGRRLAAWLRAGGVADPVIAYGPASVMRNLGGYQNYAPVTELHARMTPAPGLPERIRELFTLEPREYFAGHSDRMAWWPSVLPSHREALAAHVLECFAVDLRHRNAQVDVLPALAYGDGPVGRATAAAIVLGMGHKQPAVRVHAIDAAKILALRGELSAGDLGWALATLVALDSVTLKRVAPALEELALSGAHGETWAMLASALPALLPGGGEPARPVLADLLAVAVKAAALAGARVGPQAGVRVGIPGLAELAARKGAARPVAEARALLQAIAPA